MGRPLIRQLTESDRQATLEFLAAESAFNLFILADIYNYGFATEFQQVWGDFAGDGRLRAVLLRYFRNFIPYGRDDFDAPGLAGIIQRHVGEGGRGGWEVSGKSEVVETAADAPVIGDLYRRIAEFRSASATSAAGTWCRSGKTLRRQRRPWRRRYRSRDPACPAGGAGSAGRCPGPGRGSRPR